MCYVMPICFGDTYFVFHHGACEGVLQKNCEHGIIIAIENLTGIKWKNK